MRKKGGWIQSAIEHPGRVRRYLKRIYGEKAFTREGKIKVRYLNKAIERAKKKGNRSLLSALYLAKRLRRLRRK